ncbi:MAG: IS982 family transposase [Acidobacteria bacterium]|nr:IS982 family transposase [Acidobacteriota bacterium]
MENKLITLYLLICRLYDTEAVLKHQRLSNFKPTFTDEELLTMYIFGHLQGHTSHRRIYDYVAGHWHQWFPALPSYQAFNRRVNELSPAFELLIAKQLTSASASIEASTDRLIDSMPVMLAIGTRANRARVAREMADTGFCATKQIHYRGVKLHLIAARRSKLLPLPERLALSRASQHDLSALRELNPTLGAYGLFADKAYADAEMKAVLAARGTHLLTPYKRRRNEPEINVPTLLNRFVSSMRQPLESLFGWMIQRTDVQNASRVRSTKGLLAHCYGKLAVACLLLTSYS